MRPPQKRRSPSRWTGFGEIPEGSGRRLVAVMFSTAAPCSGGITRASSLGQRTQALIPDQPPGVGPIA